MQDDPTPEEIRELCWEFQKEWCAEEKWRRSAYRDTDAMWQMYDEHNAGFQAKNRRAAAERRGRAFRAAVAWCQLQLVEAGDLRPEQAIDIRATYGEYEPIHDPDTCPILGERNADNAPRLSPGTTRDSPGVAGSLPAVAGDRPGCRSGDGDHRRRPARAAV